MYFVKNYNVLYFVMINLRILIIFKMYIKLNSYLVLVLKKNFVNDVFFENL